MAAMGFLTEEALLSDGECPALGVPCPSLNQNTINAQESKRQCEWQACKDGKHNFLRMRPLCAPALRVFWTRLGKLKSGVLQGRGCVSPAALVQSTCQTPRQS